jgi:hypothetical protein
MAGKKRDTVDLMRQIRDSLTLAGPMTQKELFRDLSTVGYGRRIVTRTLLFMIRNSRGGVFVDGVRVPVSVKKYPKYDLYSLNEN